MTDTVLVGIALFILWVCLAGMLFIAFCGRSDPDD